MTCTSTHAHSPPTRVTFDAGAHQCSTHRNCPLLARVQMSSRTSTNPKLAGRGKGTEGPKGVAGGKRGNAGAKARRGASRNQAAPAHPMASAPGIVKFYTDDAPGIKMCVPRAAFSPSPHRARTGTHSIVSLVCLARNRPPLVQCSGPTTVLVLSLLFIGFVVLLHIWGKFQR